MNCYLIDLALDNDLDSDDEELLSELGLGPDSLGFPFLFMILHFVLLTSQTEKPTMPDPASVDHAQVSKMVHEWQHTVHSASD